MLVVQETGTPDVATWYEQEWARRVVALDGVHGVMTFQSSRQTDARTHLVLLEGDAAEQTKAIRAQAPHHDQARVTADAPFLLIEPLRYPWADAIRKSSLPQTIA
jgi:hypothetical protein